MYGRTIVCVTGIRYSSTRAIGGKPVYWCHWLFRPNCPDKGRYYCVPYQVMSYHIISASGNIIHLCNM